jgi:hypothetical protein
VFTVPNELAAIAAAHPRLFYSLLFRAVRETLTEVASDPRHLGAKIGGQMVLHTWGQSLQLHPHVHVVVPGGGLSADGQRWVHAKPNFFLCAKVLSRVFRGKLLAFLRDAYRAGRLPFTRGLAHLAQPARFLAWRQALYGREWNVYCKPPYGGTECVLKYLARYTYRVAISNDRLEAITPEGIRFRYKDYAQGGRWQRMTLTPDEFLRRFAQHILPRGFVRMRAFGFLAGPRRDEQLTRCRQLLTPTAASCPTHTPSKPGPECDEPPRCPHCPVGVLVLIEDRRRPRVPELVARTYRPGALAKLTPRSDTS